MRWREALSSGWLQASGACLVYSIFALYLTWPLITDLGSSVFLYPTAPPGPGDLAGSIAHLRELVEDWHNPFLPGRVNDFSAPEGLEIRWALNISSFSSMIVLYLLAAITGANAAFGLFVLAGYVASGLAMFLLVRRFTRSGWIGLVVGWAFAFYPFMVVNGEHPHFIHGWVFVVMVWRILELVEKPSLRAGVLAGLAAVLTLSWTQYFLLLGAVCFFAATAGALVVAAARGDLRRHLIAHLPSVGIVLAFGLSARALLQASGDDATLPGNTLADVIGSSANVGMYLVPSAFTILAGDETAPYLNGQRWNGVEWTLYVGWTTIVLAAAALVMAARRRLPAGLAPPVVLGVFVALAAVVFSLPPEAQIGGSTVRLPSYIVFEVATGWRLYTRFVIVVMLGLCLMAAVGLATLTRGRSHRARMAILVVAALLIPLDLWNRVPGMGYGFVTPPIYSMVKERSGVLAEYPLRSPLTVGNYYDLYFQDAHDRPILNGYLSGPGEQRAIALSRLDDPMTAGRLATLGVRSVLVVHPSLLPGSPDPGAVGEGFQQLGHDGYGTLFGVTAKPEPFVYSRAGLEAPEGPRSRPFRWATSAVELEVVAPCAICRGNLRFTSVSLEQPRLLTIEQDGKVLRQVVVEPNSTLISVPLSFKRRTVLDLTTVPGPRPIRDRRSQDPRSLSFSISDLRFEPS